MTLPGTPGFGVPPGPDFLVREIADLKRQIMQLTNARSLEAAEVSRGGFRVTNDGSFTVVDQVSGLPVFFVGKKLTVDGNRQMVIEMYRDDGTAVLLMGDYGTVPGHPHQEALQWVDRTGRIVLADDTTSGKGLATPHVTGGLRLADSNPTTWPATTNTAFTDIAFGYYEVHNPRVRFRFNIGADAGTTGEFKLLVGGHQIDTTQTVTAGFADWLGLQVAIDPAIAIASEVAVELQARVVSGPGSVRANLLHWSGDQTPV